MNETKPDNPAPPEKGERGRLFLAVAASCLLHAAILSITFGERSQPIYPFSHSSGTAPIVITARLLEATGSSAPTRPHGGSSAADTSSPQQNIMEPEAREVKPLVEAAGLLPLPGPVFYTTDQLTKRPRAISVAELDTPVTMPYIVRGKLILQLWIDGSGKVVDVVVEDSNLPAVFAETAGNAFKRSRFTPGERNGVPVGSVMRIEVSYDDMRLLEQ